MRIRVSSTDRVSLSDAASIDELRVYALRIVRTDAYADALAQVVIESDYPQSLDEAKRLIVRVHEAISGMRWHSLVS